MGIYRFMLPVLLISGCGSGNGGSAPDARPTPQADARPTPQADARPTTQADARPFLSPDAGIDPGECDPGLVRCGDACVDVLSDDLNCGDCGIPCDGARHCTDGFCARSNIEHVVIIVQENHTFDSYFGSWCLAPAYSEPTCTSGPSCCEAGPRVDPGTGTPVRLLDDGANLGSGVLGEDPNHNADNTLILLVWDEGGGFFDHVDPVAAWPYPPDADETGELIPHGTRVPLLAIGRFAARGTVSHVVMDHSSIVKFLEYNFLSPSLWIGQADAYVPNIGSLLDPTTTGIRIPD